MIVPRGYTGGVTQFRRVMAELLLTVIEELVHTPLRYGETYLAYLRREVSLPPAVTRASSPTG
jgi:hypothetical protein